MKALILENQLITIQHLKHFDINDLLYYLHNLSAETKNRFGPHEYSLDAINLFYKDDNNIGYIAKDSKGQIIAYTIVKKGYVQSDYNRYQSNNIDLSDEFDCTIAPSVADEWQSKRLGSSIMDYILELSKETIRKRIILWGGVQASNVRAVNFYKKYGFHWVADFEYNGLNYDMMLDLCTDK